MNYSIEGAAWVRLRDAATDEVVYDHGWSTNVVTDALRYRLAANVNIQAASVFVHQGTAPGRTNRTTLFNVFPDQTPSQIRVPDTTSFDLATAINTWTVQFPAPTVARNINIVGLTTGGLSIATQDNELFGIVAYTTLTTTVVQGTAQTADIQYRVTWSFA